MSDLEHFRAETRAWLESNCPRSMRGDTPNAADDGAEIVWGGRRATYRNPNAKLWLDSMAARGWTAPTWPKEYGGGGLSPDEARVLSQEIARIRARPPLFSFGL